MKTNRFMWERFKSFVETAHENRIIPMFTISKIRDMLELDSEPNYKELEEFAHFYHFNIDPIEGRFRYKFYPSTSPENGFDDWKTADIRRQAG